MMSLLSLVIFTIFTTSSLVTSQKNESPSKGYIIYCPCMGRFGNQAEQLLGSISFAKSLNRTLVLPPFIHYNVNHEPVLMPFESIIQVEPISDYHSVILLTDFMRLYSEEIWPHGTRKFFCYSPRKFGSDNSTCDALQGQPFNTFWTSFNISEDESQFFSPLTTKTSKANEWLQKYPASSQPVLSFVGAPSPFPTHEESIHVQRYLKFSRKLERDAQAARRSKNFSDKPYLSMHIRQGSDWKRACEIIKKNDGLTQLFSSSQCTGYASDKKLNYDTCYPSFETISQKLHESLDKHKLKHGSDIEVVHIATDNEDLKLLRNLEAKFQNLDFVMAPRDSDTMHNMMIDLYWMAYADVFIGNCISSFSAFPARIRTEQLHRKESTHYFGFDDDLGLNKSQTVHGEL